VWIRRYTQSIHHLALLLYIVIEGMGLYKNTGGISASFPGR